MQTWRPCRFDGLENAEKVFRKSVSVIIIYRQSTQWMCSACTALAAQSADHSQASFPGKLRPDFSDACYETEGLIEERTEDVTTLWYLHVTLFSYDFYTIIVVEDKGSRITG